MKTKYIFILLLAICCSISGFAQVVAELSIENKTVSGTEVSFDIYLNTLSGTSGDLLLGNATLVLNYHTGNFNNPTFSQVGASAPGFVTLVPSDQSGINTLLLQAGYFGALSTSITNGELIISLNGPTPGSQTSFNSSVARIDGTTSTHRLGRFKLTGISNSNGDLGLMWKGSGAGFITKVFTLGDTSPFISTRVTSLTLTNGPDIPLPVEVSQFRVVKEGDNSILIWKTATEQNMSHFELEHSLDALKWNEIGRVTAKGNLSDGADYEYIHDDPVDGENYYRIRMVELNGASEFTDIKVVNHSFLFSELELELFPNPTVDLINVKWTISEQDGTSFLELHDVKGKLIQAWESDNKSNSESIIDVSKYATGMYFISLRNGENHISRRFIKN